MTNDVKLSAPKRRKKIASLDRRKARAGWFFVLPFLIGFVLIYLPMVWQSLQISFSKIVIGGASGTYDMVWVGFQNYSDAIQVDPEFTQILLKGLGSLAIDIPAILIECSEVCIKIAYKSSVARVNFRYHCNCAVFILNRL